LLSRMAELGLGTFAFRHTAFVFGVVLDQVVVEQHQRTMFCVLRILAYRFRVWPSVGSGDC
jgi:hypothetical protein